MSVREKQREETRQRIINAAIAAFAEFGFHGASTRDIAQRAKTTQGLLTYHFDSKDDLWRAATDRIFSSIRTAVLEKLKVLPGQDMREAQREAIRVYVRFAAAYPELFRIMLDENKGSSDRMKWVVKTHLKPLYTFMSEFLGTTVEPERLPHIYYVLVGAGSVIFTQAPECRALTGFNPRTKEAVEAHADFVAQLLVP